MTRAALLAAAVAIAAGCGAQKPVTEAAELVPPSARGLVSVRGDLAPLERVPFLARRLPLVAPFLRGQVGKEVDVAFLPGGRLGLTQPPNENRFAKQLAARGWAHVRRRGWVLYSSRKALLRSTNGSLAEDASYRAAMAALPSGGLVRSYRIPATAVVAKHGDALRIEVLRRTAGPESELVAEIPASAVVAAGVARPTTFFGVDVRALGGPAVAWAKPGRPIPSVTIVSAPTRPREALRAVGRAVAQLASTDTPPVAEEIGGVTFQHLALGAIDLYWALHDDRIVLTDDPAVAAAHDSHLDLSALPERTTRWVYVDERALPAAEAFAHLLHVRIPPELVASMAPLRSLLAWETRDRAGAIVRSR